MFFIPFSLGITKPPMVFNSTIGGLFLSAFTDFMQNVSSFALTINYCLISFSQPQAKPLKSFTQLSRDCTLTVPERLCITLPLPI